ncbi:TipAS antibiotic-recognition domain-containing protein [Arthrobacter ginkgonis]|uniref:TipAS antibiotic-recognition domain-containing protein n=1 Tax=Arthrobacter ginkgonis TaxID=1630594 RepID=A0ABP7CG13_9MICC
MSTQSTRSPQQTYGIAELARQASVSSRTLRHYHRLGLLVPAHIGANGYRYYGWEEALRLQRILLLRDLGLGLEAIGEVLDGGRSPVEALRSHRRWLEAELRRLAAMARTVDTTIERLISGGTMEPREMFNGFGKNPYEEEARERWGEAAVDRSNARLAALPPGGREAMLEEAVAINAELAACMAEGEPADGERAQEAAARHYRWVCLSWTPDREAYLGLGRMYVEDSRFTAFYDQPKDSPARPGLAAYLSEAMDAYAQRRL